MIPDRFPRIWLAEEVTDFSALPPGDDVLYPGPEALPAPAVLEEMQQVLHAGERHGAACPRLAQPGHWTSFPAVLPEGARALDAEEAVRAHARLAAGLPRYGVIPGAPQWPVLMRGDLVRRFGGPAPADRSPLSATLRWSRFGYSTVVAHRVLHRPIPAPSSRPEEFPMPAEFAPLRDHYLQREVHPLERFAGLFAASGSRRPRLLFCFTSLSAGFNGTSEYGLSLLRQFLKRHAERFEVAVLAAPAAAEFHGLRAFVPQVVHPDEPLGAFDLGFLPCQVMDREQLALLDRHCLRIAFTFLDLIWFRCGHRLARDPGALDRLALAVDFADGATAISASVQSDVEAFFPGRFNGGGPLLRTILLGQAEIPADISLRSEPDGPILVVGNHYVHKALSPAVAALAGVERSVVVVGGPPPAVPAPARIAHYPSGNLSPQQMDQLYRTCAVLVFPSQYEGFGLPVVRALALGKPVVLFSSDTSREVVARFSVFPGQAVFCDTFEELPSAVARALETGRSAVVPPARPPRSWDDVADDTARFFDELLARPPEADRLLRRSVASQRVRDLLAAEEMARRSPAGVLARALAAIFRKIQQRLAGGPRP